MSELANELRTRRERAIRIGNCSGFYGDRIAVAQEMVEGGPASYRAYSAGSPVQPAGSWAVELRGEPFLPGR
jgi:hypothetical protein